MRKLFAIVLAAILGFLGTMALSHVPRNVMVYQDRQIERGANMTSFELNDSDVVEVDGIQFRTVMPERVIRIPLKQEGAKTQVQFGIQITNQTANPRYFLLFAVRPQFRQANQQKVPESGPLANTAGSPESSDFKLLIPGESATFLVEGCFEWIRNELKFPFTRKDAVHWWYGKFQGSGTYSIHVIYENPYPDWEQASWKSAFFTPMWTHRIRNRPMGDIIKIENVWAGEVVTSPLEFHLIQ